MRLTSQKLKSEKFYWDAIDFDSISIHYRFLDNIQNVPERELFGAILNIDPRDQTTDKASININRLSDVIHNAVYNEEWAALHQYLQHVGIEFAQREIDHSNWLKKAVLAKKKLDDYVIKNCNEGSILVQKGLSESFHLITQTIATSFFEEQTNILNKKIKEQSETIEQLQSALQIAQKKEGKLKGEVDQRTYERDSTLKELNSITYAVSHDLRAPLRAVSGFSRVFTDNKLEGKEARYMQIIVENIDKINDLIEDLLKYSRVGRIEKQEVKINQNKLVQAIYDELTQKYHLSNVQFSLNNLPNIKADNELVRQVWWHLMDNAIKFSSQKEQPTIDIGIESDKNEVIYYVKDNGVGFDNEYAHKMFEIFQKIHSDSSYSGNGMGLAIVQRIINVLNGKIWANSTKDVETTFYFTIPKT